MRIRRETRIPPTCDPTPWFRLDATALHAANTSNIWYRTCHQKQYSARNDALSRRANAESRPSWARAPTPLPHSVENPRSVSAQTGYSECLQGHHHPRPNLGHGPPLEILCHIFFSFSFLSSPLSFSSPSLAHPTLTMMLLPSQRPHILA